MKQKLFHFWDSIADWLFTRFIILFALAFLLFLMAIEKLLPAELTSKTPEQYQDYARRNPVKAWLLKWPLRLVAMCALFVTIRAVTAAPPIPPSPAPAAIVRPHTCTNCPPTYQFIVKGQIQISWTPSIGSQPMDGLHPFGPITNDIYAQIVFCNTNVARGGEVLDVLPPDQSNYLISVTNFQRSFISIAPTL